MPYSKDRVECYNLDGGREVFLVDPVQILGIDTDGRRAFIERLGRVVSASGDLWRSNSYVNDADRSTRRERWVKLVMRALCLCLGVKLRCVLSRAEQTAEFHARVLLVELQGGEVHFNVSPKEVVEVIGLQNLFVAVRQRRMVDLRDESGNEMLNDPALQINFLPIDSGLSDYARAYEWLRWPDLMSYVGFNRLNNRGDRLLSVLLARVCSRQEAAEHARGVVNVAFDAGSLHEANPAGLVSLTLVGNV